MRSFIDLDRVLGRVPARTVTTLGAVDFGRGCEALYRLLQELADRARVASVTASSAIEGIVVPDSVRAENITRGQAKATIILRSVKLPTMAA